MTTGVDIPHILEILAELRDVSTVVPGKHEPHELLERARDAIRRRRAILERLQTAVGEHGDEVSRVAAVKSLVAEIRASENDWYASLESGQRTSRKRIEASRRVRRGYP